MRGSWFTLLSFVLLVGCAAQPDRRAPSAEDGDPDGFADGAGARSPRRIDPQDSDVAAAPAPQVAAVGVAQCKPITTTRSAVVGAQLYYGASFRLVKIAGTGTLSSCSYDAAALLAQVKSCQSGGSCGVPMTPQEMSALDQQMTNLSWGRVTLGAGVAEAAVAGGATFVRFDGARDAFEAVAAIGSGQLTGTPGAASALIAPYLCCPGCRCQPDPNQPTCPPGGGFGPHVGFFPQPGFPVNGGFAVCSQCKSTCAAQLPSSCGCFGLCLCKP
jgi:hypothetical protein